MDPKKIYSKTGKGVLEIKNKAGKLSKDLLRILTLIDGKSSVADLVSKSRLSDPDMDRVLRQLEEAGYIKEFTNPSSAGLDSGAPDTSYVDDLDFTASLPPGKRVYQTAQTEWRAREEADRKKAEEEARRKREEEERRKKEETSRAAREEAARMARMEAERKAKEAAALKAREELERKAKLQAQEMAKTTRDLSKVLEAERRTLEEADRKKREESDRQARVDAERKAKDDAEQKTKEEAERRVREEAERRKREEEEARRRKEEEERKRREEEDRRRREEEERRRREEEEARRRREEEERRRREEEEERKRREEEEARLRREEDDRKRREEEDRRRAEEDMRRREEDERRRREDEGRRLREEEEARQRAAGEDRVRAEREEQERRDEEARRQREETEARRRIEEAAASVQLDRIELPPVQESGGSFLAEFERQQEALRKQAEEEERRRREAEESRLAMERAEREEHARMEAERRAVEEAEIRARMEAEEAERRERERRKAEEYERKIKEGEERKKREAEEKDRKEQEKLEAGRRAREEELARKRKEAEEADRKRRELKALKKQGRVKSPLDRFKPMAIGLVAIVAIAFGIVELMPMGGYVPSVEKLASQHIKEPVNIGSIRISVLSGFDIELENVRIGTTQDVKISKVRLSPDFISLSSDRKVIREMEIETATAAQEVLARLPAWLQAASADKSVTIGRIVLRGVKLETRELQLPALNADLRLDPDGNIVQARVETADSRLSADIIPQQADKFDVSINGSSLTLPMGVPLELADISAKGVATTTSLRLDEFDARFYDGVVKGGGLLSWASGWRGEGDFELARVDAGKLLSVFTRSARVSGTIEGRGHFAAQSDKVSNLLDAPRMELSFTVRRGDVDGADLVRALQAGREGTQGGVTKFEELSGALALSAGRYQYRNLKLAAGILNASGSFDIAPNQEVGGRVYVELRSQAQQLHANLNVTGSLKAVALRP